MTRAADENGRAVSPLRGLRRILLGALVVGLAACGGDESSFTSGGAVNEAVDAVAVEAGAATLVADDGNSRTRIQATVNDGVGQPVEDASVRFTTTLGGFENANADGDAEAKTNDAGIAAATLTTGPRTGTATVEVFVGEEIKGETTVGFVAGPPRTVTVALDATEVELGQSVQGTVEVTDANGNRVPNEPVILEFVNTPANGDLGEAGGDRQTDTTGIAAFTYTAGSAVGEDRIQAQAGGAVSEPIAVQSVSPLDRLTLSADRTQLPADGSTPVTLTATTLGRGNAIAGGVEVAFSASSGILSQGTVTTGTTDGQATVQLRPGDTTEESIQVTATAQGVSAEPVAIDVVAGGAGETRTLQLEAGDGSLDFGEETELRARVQDAAGNPLSGVPVDFEFVANGAGGELSATTAETGANGIAQVTYTASDRAGTDAFRARVPESILVDPAEDETAVSVQVVSPVSTVRLLVSNPNLPSDGSAPVTLTAIVLDQAGRSLANQPVDFSTTSGALEVVSDTTDASGEAEATLTVAGNPAPRTIRVSASTAAVSSDEIPVRVTGTSLTLDGPASIGAGQTVAFRITLQDSAASGIADQPITVTNPNGVFDLLDADGEPIAGVDNPIPTNVNGRVTVQVAAPASDNGTRPDNGTLAVQAYTDGDTDPLSADQGITINDSNFRFDEASPNAFNVDTCHEVTVLFRDDQDRPVDDETVRFASSRGILAGPGQCPADNATSTVAVQSDNGTATVDVFSTSAGPARLSASTPAMDGPSAQFDVRFIADNATSMTLQSDKTNLIAEESVTLKAVVRDPRGNRVEDAEVVFNVSDVNRGELSSATATTNADGRATVDFTAGSFTGGFQGVDVTARLQDKPGVADTLRLTVGQEATDIVLQTGNQLTTVDTTTYRQPWVVQVTDASGLPVEGARVSLSADPIRYLKGEYVVAGTEDEEQWQPSVEAICPDEDLDSDNILDPGEDRNQNGRLDPPNPTAIIAENAVTDADGRLQFDLQYPKGFANWLEVRLRASVEVAGTERTTSQDFELLVLFDDVSNTDIVPPGDTPSPFGVSNDCRIFGVGQAENIFLDVGSDTVIADGAQQVQVTADVVDQNGLPVQDGVPVAFTILDNDNAAIDDEGITNDGRAVATFTAPPTPDNVTIRARVTPEEGPSVSAETTVRALGFEFESLRAEPAQLIADGVSGAVIRVALRDSDGVAVPGREVTFSTDSGTLQSRTAVTNPSGVATVELIAASEPDNATVTAQVPGAGSETVTVAMVSPPETRIGGITVEAGTDQLVAGANETAAVRATVTDLQGEPLNDQLVDFSTTLGSFEGSGTGGVVSASTDPAGIAEARLQPGEAVGTAEVRASIEGFIASTTVDIVAAQIARVITSAPDAVIRGERFQVAATVFDTEANPLADQPVTFAFADQQGNPRFTAVENSDPFGVAAIELPPEGTPPEVFYDNVTRLDLTVRAGSDRDNATIQVEPGPQVDEATLLVSSPTLNSGGNDSVTLTALVRAANGNLLQGVPVSFGIFDDPGVLDDGSNNGAIQVTQGTTNASGTAAAALTPGGDASLRTISVRAAADGVSGENQVDVVGTNLEISGPTSLVQGDSAVLDIRLADSEGKGIANQPLTLTNQDPGIVSLTTPVLETGPDGSLTATATGVSSGSGTLTAEALGVADSATLQVTATTFEFRTPTADQEISLDNGTAVELLWDDGSPGDDQVQFSTTRGTITGGDVSPDVDTTDNATDPGIATVDLNANNAGPAVITATAVQKDGAPITDPADQLTAQIPILFVATNPNSLNAQAIPTTIGTGGEQATIEAVVRDPDGNPVKNERVNFNLSDVTGGSLSRGFNVTDELGRATTTYTSSDLSSAADGVRVDVTLDSDPTIADNVTLTVAERELFITFGTGRELEVVDTTRYRKPYSALVSDAVGNGIDQQPVELVAVPTRFRKGFYVQTFDENGEFVAWVPRVTAVCPNEDGNFNGILEPDLGEDITGDGNGNGRLEPGNVAAVPSDIETDDEGFGAFGVTYFKDRANWIDLRLEARAEVDGTEFVNREDFTLPVLADDTTEEDVPPPGVVSPYGTSGDCTCSVQDEIDGIPGCGSVAIAQLEVEADPTAVSAGNQSQLTATLTGPQGQPIGGQTVNFTIVQNSSGATLSSPTATTDSAGEARVNYTAGTGITNTVSDIIQINVSSIAGQVSITVFP
jgi:protocatechuate 3,4-dioxygenase beta subunit